MRLTYIDKSNGDVKVFGATGRLGTIVRIDDDLYQFRKTGGMYLDRGPKFSSIEAAKTHLDGQFGDVGSIDR